MDFLDLCKKAILIDSTPEAGTSEIARFGAELFRGAGLDVEIHDAFLYDKKQTNLVARPKGSNRKNEVIFQTHLDTVDPGPNAAWTETDHNAFKATVKSDKIFGLGTADVKLDMLCKYRALREFAGEKFRHPFVFVGTYAEELGMEGAKQMMEAKLVNAKMAIIGEPSELQIVYANNGYGLCVFEIPFSKEEAEFKRKHGENDSTTTQEKLFHGKAAHSSTPHLGDNAILKLVEYISKMPDGVGILEASGGTVPNTVPARAHVEIDPSFTLPRGKPTVGMKLVNLVRELQKLEREFLNYEKKEFSPPTPTLNIGVLKTTPSALKLSVSFRFTPQITKDQVEQWWDKLKKYSKENGMTFEEAEITPSALTPLDSELIRGAMEISKKLKLPEKPITKASATECSVYRQYDIECMVFGPGVSIGNSHTANEYNILSHLESATEFYREAVRKFCL